MSESLNSAKRVFISYARNDTIHAEQIEQHLLAKGFQIWRDKRNLDPSQDFTGEIEAAIREASSIVVCLTRDVQRKDSFVRREIAYALNRKKRIIPLMFPEGELPIQIATWTYIDMSKADSFDQLTNRLINDREKGTTPLEIGVNPGLVDYLNLLHEWISRQLQDSVHTLITLAVAETSHAVSTSAVSSTKGFGFNFVVSKATIEDHSSASASDQGKIAPLVFQSLADALSQYKHRMLLLGEPGAGKTTVLLALARDAAVACLNDPSQPIPILASIHRWNSQLAVPEWAIGQQPTNSPAIFHGHKLLFILDGLDELNVSGSDSTAQLSISKQELQRKFIDSVERDVDGPVIISCRSKEYDQIGKHISLTGAVTLQPLNDPQIEAYLSERNRGALWTAIQKDPELLDMSRIPLLLALLVVATSDEQALEAITGQADIYERYIHRRFVHELSKLDCLPFSEQESRQMLEWLASQMYKRALVSIEPKEIATLSAETEVSKQKIPDADIGRFTIFSRTMHFLQFLPNGDVQFIHLGLRDFLAIPPLMLEFEQLPLRTRLAVMQTLLTIPNKETRMSVLKALNDPVVRIRCDAARVLGETRAFDIVSGLIESLRSEPSVYVRREIIEALAYIGSEEAIEPICGVLDAELARTGAAHFLPDEGSIQDISVLLVSDEPGIATLIGISVKRFGFELLYGRDPSHAESLAKQFQPSIAYIYGSDHIDPQRGLVSGIDVINGILHVSPLTSVLIISAAGTSAQQAFEAEAVEFLHTPLSPKEMEKRFKTLGVRHSLSSTALKALKKIGTPYALQRYNEYLRKSE